MSTPSNPNPAPKIGIGPGTRKHADKAGFPATPAASTMPPWYQDLLESVSQRIQLGRLSSTTAITRELISTNWTIGRLILDRQNSEGWGAKVIDRLAADLKTTFPGTRGFSPRNLKYMRSFAEAWPHLAIVQGLAQLPWYHHIALLEKLNDADTRLWYAAAAVEQGWSRDVLVHQIGTKLHERSGKAINNFKATLPPSDSDLAEQSFSDPYVFDFVAMTDRRNERELENQLVDHIQKFLLELGQGFAFVGRQVRLAIGDDEFFADLLFYHLKLRAYVVVELKATKFDPGYLGQLGMYMAAVDDLLAHTDDKPTIGLLLCKSKNDLVAEYALRTTAMPIGVSEWKAEIVDSLPEEFASTLPSISELEAELSGDISE
ncbi:PDDEXK nuclease domain-containing protein [Pseudarthrobacter albicanus]|uniref:PDDEXK nuclease domain-containing protein n=1 Tax=Pseudarthrobacter albicanus TaxID=2823873 RepID=UPI001BAC076F|nr:PDDEXK nuclease domain-containing protein [Pseudarthrobacter albicanus]